VRAEERLRRAVAVRGSEHGESAALRIRTTPLLNSSRDGKDDPRAECGE
jgi:hypothetical protein